jgi:hypothetical protein
VKILDAKTKRISHYLSITNAQNEVRRKMIIPFISDLATRIGVSCIIVQIIFTILFRYILPPGPWTLLSGFTAHKIVCLPCMVLLTYIGCRDWCFYTTNYNTGSAMERIWGEYNAQDIPLAYGIGAMLLWDIPMSILSPPMHDPFMLAHHVMMFLVAYSMSGGFCSTGRFIGYYYAPFYFGVIELSSIPLSYVNIFHPKQVPYYEWTTTKQTTDNPRLESLRLLVVRSNEIARVTFAVTFLLLRGLYFPYVSFCMCLPDLITAYKDPPEGVPMATGYFLISSIFTFSCLQAYWGVLVAKQVIKAIRTGKAEIHVEKNKKGE